MTQLPAPVVKAYDQTSHYVTDFGTWYVAQLYSLAGLFYGALLGVFIEGKGLLIKGKEEVEKSDATKDIKNKVNETAKSAKSSATNGYAQATGETPGQTKQKAQHTANNVKHDAKHTAKH